MTLKKRLTNSPDLLVVIGIGIISLIVAGVDNVAVRVLFGFPFIFLASGYPATAIVFPRKKLQLLEAIMISSVMSLLLMYPAAVLTVVREGQGAIAIYQMHIINSLSSLFILQVLLTIFAFVRRGKQAWKGVNNLKLSKWLLISLLIYSIMTLTNLNRADANHDEYDLGYQAYDLVNGIFAGRKAYTVSFDGHPPLAIHIKHFTMQLLNPDGIDTLEDWQFRVTESVLGLLTIAYTYHLAEKFFSKKVAVIVALLLAVNNYLVFMGRFYERAIYITPLSVASIYFYLRFVNSKERKFLLLSGIAVGGALLVKASALSILLTIIVFTLVTSSQRIIPLLKLNLVVAAIYSPVIAFNLASYITTGYVDTNFSRILNHSHPHSTSFPKNPLLINPPTILSLLTDQYSLPIMLLFIISVLYLLIFKNWKPSEKLDIIWIGSILILFSLTVVRAYYMVFITIPLALLASTLFEKALRIKPKVAHCALIVILIYSAFYSYNTNIDDSYTIGEQFNDAGRSGTPLLWPSISRHFSISARSWTEEFGWKILVSELDEIITANDCIQVSEKLSDMVVRRYLGINDRVKQFYQGDEYISRFPRCDKTDVISGKKYVIEKIKTGSGNNPVKIIRDHLGNERFYLYEQGGKSLSS